MRNFTSFPQNASQVQAVCFKKEKRVFGTERLGAPEAGLVNKHRDYDKYETFQSSAERCHKLCNEAKHQAKSLPSPAVVYVRIVFTYLRHFLKVFSRVTCICACAPTEDNGRPHFRSDLEECTEKHDCTRTLRFTLTTAKQSKTRKYQQSCRKVMKY